MTKTVNTIINALAQLGYKGRVSGEYVTEDRVRLFLNGEYLGVWDADKNTFVD